MPKQFLKVFDGRSLFQKTIERNSKISNSCIVISNIDQYFIAYDDLEELDNKFSTQNVKFLLEETGKNTAPAITFAALESDGDEILFVTPSDHLIKNEKAYKKAIAKAKELAEQGYIVTFGIKPTEANTGYGYIEAEKEDVIKFHEKPNLETAKKYVEKDNYYWNSGMFMFRASVFLEELKKFSKDVYDEVLKSYKNKQMISENQIRLKDMSGIPDISIDYAVMEKSKKIKVVASDIDWSDVGSFDSLIKDISSKEAIEIDAKHNFYYKDNENKVIATIGLKDIVVVDTRDALLISKKGETQKVKDVVDVLKAKHIELTKTHMTVHRPWGTYENLIDAEGYKIKRIVVKPGKRLSLQKHFHRNEHWIVVSGTATVTVGERTQLVRPNESTYIKMGEVHRLANNGKIPVVLIEAQVGEYTGEDDIVRIEDDFKR